MALSAPADYPLVLTTGRLLERYHSGTMTRRVPALDWLVPEALVDVLSDKVRAVALEAVGP